MQKLALFAVFYLARATNVWQALHSKVESDLKPAREVSGFSHLLKNLKSTGMYGEYKYDQGAVVASIDAWTIPTDLKKQVQTRVRAMIRAKSSVEYRSFALRMQGGTGALHELVCSMRHLPDGNGTASQTVQLAFVYAKATADLIQQHEERSFCCNRILNVCIRHCTEHEQINRDLKDSELSLILSVLVHECYEYLSSSPSSTEAVTKYSMQYMNLKHDLGGEVSPLPAIAATFTI
mmetsp:Transcript_46422/g.81686  ORF Transcript_46422/g.81686 Transcript_46422/m.81686 type:complete len:236 (+) Transcript_46422:64-771(+)